MVDAKPCPFCGAGSGAQHRVSSRRNEESWACSSCGARGPSVERDGSDGPLIEAWNARASIAAAITDRKFVEAADELRSIAEAEGWDWNAPKDAPNRYEKELAALRRRAQGVSIEEVVDALLHVQPFRDGHETGSTGLVCRADVEQVMRALFDRRGE